MQKNANVFKYSSLKFFYYLFKKLYIKFVFKKRLYCGLQILASIYVSLFSNTMNKFFLKYVYLNF